MLPADCLWFDKSSKSSQHMAKFKAGAIDIGSPANTGNDNSNKIAVIKIAHTNKGNLCKDIPGALIFKTVVIKLIDPNNDDTPAKCKLNIAKSTEPPECDWIPAKGGYTVHPVPAPFSTKALNNNNVNEVGNNQNETLLSRGKAQT